MNLDGVLLLLAAIYPQLVITAVCVELEYTKESLGVRDWLLSLDTSLSFDVSFTV